MRCRRSARGRTRPEREHATCHHPAASVATRARPPPDERASGSALSRRAPRMRQDCRVTSAPSRPRRQDSTRSAPPPSTWPATRITEVDADVGEHLGVVAEGERVVTHFFECTLPGYRGWRWAVTVARAPRSKHVTVCETVLLPGDDALLAPGWVPWHERLQPGDLGVGDLLPTPPDDDRLAPGYVLSDDPAVEEVSWELGLGRRPGDVPRGPGRGRPALVRRRPRPGRADLGRRAGRRPAAARAGSTCRWPARCGRPSASAATCSRPTTAGWSPPTTAAARTPRSCSRRSSAGRGAAHRLRRQRGRVGRGQPRGGLGGRAGEPAEPYGHG